MKQRPSIASLRTWCNRIENLSVACCNRRPILHIPISNRAASMNVIWLSFFSKPTEIFNHIFHASRHNMTLIQVSDKDFFSFPFNDVFLGCAVDILFSSKGHSRFLSLPCDYFTNLGGSSLGGLSMVSTSLINRCQVQALILTSFFSLLIHSSRNCRSENCMNIACVFLSPLANKGMIRRFIQGWLLILSTERQLRYYQF